MLCSELKQLYVVLTRARQRLWIYDENAERIAPMQNLWLTMNVVQVSKLHDWFVNTSIRESTHEEWYKRGIEMFNNRNYEAAQMSFECAIDTNNSYGNNKNDHYNYYYTLSKAAFEQQTASKLRYSDPKEATKKYASAADNYFLIQRMKEAAECQKLAGNWQRAGEIFRDNCHPPMFKEVGSCFETSKVYKEAIECYSSCEMFKQALVCCFKAGYYKDGVEKLESWKMNIQKNLNASNSIDQAHDFHVSNAESNLQHNLDALESLKSEYIQKCAYQTYRNNDLKKMMFFVNLFPSIDMQRTFLERRDLFDEWIELEIRNENFQKAAEILLMKGDLDKAGEMFLRVGQKKSALEAFFPHARNLVFWKDGSIGWPLRKDALPELKKTKELALECDCGDMDVDEIEVLIFLLSDAMKDLSECWQKKEVLQDRPYLPWLISVKEMELALKEYENLRAEMHSRGSDDACKITSVSNGSESFDENLAHVINSLFKSWRSWRFAINNLLRSMNHMHKEDENSINSCLLFFVTKRIKERKMFMVENREASWISGCKQLRSLPNQQNRAVVSSKVFSKHALKYFKAHVSVYCSKCIQSIESAMSTFLVPRGSHSAERGILLLRLYDMESFGEEWGADESSMSDTKHQHMQQFVGLVTADLPEKENLHEIVWLRNLPESTELLENYASEIVEERRNENENGMDLFDYATVVRLQILLPFLDAEWLQWRVESLKQRFLRSYCDPRFRMWQSALWENRVRRIPLKYDKCCIFEYAKLQTIALDDIFNKVSWWEVKGYVPPIQFIRLLEKAIVCSCSVITSFDNLLIPINLAIDHMTATGVQQLFSDIFRKNCTIYFQKIKTRIYHGIKLILDLLEYHDNFEWIKMNHEYTSDELRPSIILRLFTLLFFSMENFKWRGRDNHFRRDVILRLNQIFSSNSPIPELLPFQCRKCIEDNLQSFKLTSDMGNYFFNLRVMFEGFVEVSGDSVVNLVRKGTTIPKWLSRFKRVNVEFFNAKGLSYFNIHELIKDCDLGTCGVMETVLSEESMDTGLFSSITEREEEAREIVETEKIHAFDDEDAQNVIETESNKSLDEETNEVETFIEMTSDSMLPEKFSTKLKEVLAKVREKIKNRFSPLDQDIQTAQKAFRENPNISIEYRKYYLEYACPLKVKMDDLLENINQTIDLMKSRGDDNHKQHMFFKWIRDKDEILDNLCDIREKIHQQFEILDILNPMYRHMALDELQVKLGNLINSMDSCHEMYDPIFQNLPDETPD